MVLINFGNAGYDVRDHDWVFDVNPDTLLKPILQDITDLYLSIGRSKPRRVPFDSKGDEKSYHEVIFNLDNKPGGDWLYMHLLWEEGRKEWLGFREDVWIESSRGKDSRFDGPYALDQYCSQAILTAYRIPTNRMPLESVPRTSPQSLEDIFRVSVESSINPSKYLIPNWWDYRF